MKDKKHVIWAQYTDGGKIVETIRCSTDATLGAARALINKYNQ